MALEGNYKITGYSDKYMLFAWSATQNVANNTSTISWQLTGGDPDGGYVKAGGFKVVIDGETVYSKSTDYRIKMYTGTMIASGSKTITHNADGSRSFTVYCEAGIYTYAVNCTGSKSWTLNTIPRKSSLTAGNGTLGTAQTLTISRHSSTFYHRIKYSCGSASANIQVNGSDKLTGTSVSFTPPISLAAQNTTGTSLSVTLTLYTYASNNTLLGSVAKAITCAIPASIKPTLSLAVSDPTGYLSTYGGYVQGRSTIRAAVTAAGAQGSTIKAYKTTANGKTYTTATATTTAVSSSGTLTVSSTVTDTRGRTATASQTITALAYSPAVVNALQVYRSDANGVADASGEYLTAQFNSAVTALSNKNTATYTLKYKKITASAYTTVTLSSYANNYAVTDGKYTFAAETAASYNVGLAVADAFDSNEKTALGPTASKTFSIRSKGKGFAFGKIAEKDNALESEWDVYAPRLRLSSTSDASQVSTGHALQIGPDTGVNLIMDNNEIQARNNGAVSTLGINAEGGSVTIGNVPAAGIQTIWTNPSPNASFAPQTVTLSKAITNFDYIMAIGSLEPLTTSKVYVQSSVVPAAVGNKGLINGMNIDFWEMSRLFTIDSNTTVTWSYGVMYDHSTGNKYGVNAANYQNRIIPQKILGIRAR